MKKGLGLVIAIILIVVGCLGYFGYRYMTPKKVLVRTLHSYKEKQSLDCFLYLCLLVCFIYSSRKTSRKSSLYLDSTFLI